LNTKTKKYIFYLMMMLLAALFGILSRSEQINFPHLIRTFAGDTMWAFAAYFLVRLFLINNKIISVFLGAYGLSLFVELSQLLKWDILVAFRNTTIGGLLIGFGFHWEDLICYLAGCLIALVIDYLFLLTINK
jgi:hypothetical protein